MAIRISDKHDTMVLAMIAGMDLSAANADTFLQNIKTQLDATVGSFKDSNGDYPANLVKQAALIVRSRGK